MKILALCIFLISNCCLAYDSSAKLECRKSTAEQGFFYFEVSPQELSGHFPLTLMVYDEERNLIDQKSMGLDLDLGQPVVTFFSKWGKLTLDISPGDLQEDSTYASHLEISENGKALVTYSADCDYFVPIED